MDRPQLPRAVGIFSQIFESSPHTGMEVGVEEFTSQESNVLARLALLREEQAKLRQVSPAMRTCVLCKASLALKLPEDCRRWSWTICGKKAKSRRRICARGRYSCNVLPPPVSVRSAHTQPLSDVVLKWRMRHSRSPDIVQPTPAWRPTRVHHACTPYRPLGGCHTMPNHRLLRSVCFILRPFLTNDVMMPR